MPVRFRLLIFLLMSPLAAQDAAIPPDEIARQPTATRIATLVDRAAQQGWGSVTPVLRSAAQQAYESGSGYAPAWYYLYRWGLLLGTPADRATGDWIKAMETAGAAHPNLASSYESRPGSLSGGLTRELLLALLGNGPLSEEFFQVQSSLDRASEVLGVLQRLHRKDAAAFGAYGSLALAIAIVHDVPPPPWWPHGQVSASALSRTLQPPEEIFAYFVRLDRAGSTGGRLRRLPASELKFLVDFSAPLAELDWARQNVPPGITDLGKAYDMVRYRKDRADAGQHLWPGPSYPLSLILQQGGICVDQAYFASMAGKAKGIPTMMFRGAGLDGRHAWFGYLDAGQRWQLDSGRYAEQKYVVGLAFDPQTWKDINDHELLFISERFRALPTYKLSVMHAEFAADYLREGKIDQAAKAARESVNRDSRNLAGWQTLIRVQEARGGDLRAKEAVLREAILAFQRYPDLEINFSRQLIAVLRQRGETSLASVEEDRLGRKYHAKREDLGIDQAAAAVRRSMETDDLATQIKIYNRVVDTAGRGAATDFYDKVVVPFVLHLAMAEQVPAALQSLQRARRTLRVEAGQQLEREMIALENRLRTGNYPKKAPDS